MKSKNITRTFDKKRQLSDKQSIEKDLNVMIQIIGFSKNTQSLIKSQTKQVLIQTRILNEDSNARQTFGLTNQHISIFDSQSDNNQSQILNNSIYNNWKERFFYNMDKIKNETMIICLVTVDEQGQLVNKQKRNKYQLGEGKLYFKEIFNDETPKNERFIQLPIWKDNINIGNLSIRITYFEGQSIMGQFYSPNLSLNIDKFSSSVNNYTQFKPIPTKTFSIEKLKVSKSNLFSFMDSFQFTGFQLFPNKFKINS